MVVRRGSTVFILFLYLSLYRFFFPLIVFPCVIFQEMYNTKNKIKYKKKVQRISKSGNILIHEPKQTDIQSGRMMKSRDANLTKTNSSVPIIFITLNASSIKRVLLSV